MPCTLHFIQSSCLKNFVGFEHRYVAGLHMGEYDETVGFWTKFWTRKNFFIWACIIHYFAYFLPRNTILMVGLHQIKFGFFMAFLHVISYRFLIFSHGGDKRTEGTNVVFCFSKCNDVILIKANLHVSSTAQNTTFFTEIRGEKIFKVHLPRRTEGTSVLHLTNYRLF